MLQRVKRLNRVQRFSLLLLVVILLCRMAGFTSAWFISSDEVNNHFGVKNSYINIAILEPNWSSVGYTQASKLQPGMTIFKDPRVQNIYEDSCYIRMKYEIVDSNGDEISGDRLKAIQSAIRYYVGEDSYTDYNTTDFTLVDGWYYYTSGNLCRLLDPVEVTAPLFTDVVIPIKTVDYRYFSEPFNIVVKAEAVFGAGIEDDSATVESIKARFEAVTDEEKQESEEAATFAARSARRYSAPVYTNTSQEAVTVDTTLASDTEATYGEAVSVSGFGEVQ